MNGESLQKKKDISLFFFLLYLGCLPLVAQHNPRTYIAAKTTDSISVDGKMEETSWKKASWSRDFIDIEGVIKPLYMTNMKMLWDKDYLYFLARIEEPHVWGTLKQRDTVIFYNNDFEIFLDPDGDTHNYMEFEMNALNTVWDLFLTKPYRNHGKVLDSWDIQGIKSAVHVDGTINNAADIDKGWTIEVAMPWKVLKEFASHNEVPENEFWRIGFSRVNWKYDLQNGRYSRKKDSNGKFMPEFNWVWSPQWVINMHEPEKWGYVYFSPMEAGEETAFEIPKDEHIKWYLYEVYRKLKDEPSPGILEESTKIIFGSVISPQLEKFKTGWHIWVKSPFTKQILSIKDDGKFTSYK